MKILILSAFMITNASAAMAAPTPCTIFFPRTLDSDEFYDPTYAEKIYQAAKKAIADRGCVETKDPIRADYVLRIDYNYESQDHVRRFATFKNTATEEVRTAEVSIPFIAFPWSSVRAVFKRLIKPSRVPTAQQPRY